MTLPAIHTIGYEGAAIDGLIATLKSARVAHLIDVRHSPYSRRPEFSKDELKAALGDYGIVYTHIEALGNPPAGREAARVGHMAVYREVFTNHLNSVSGQKGLKQALELAVRENVCLLCLEKSANHCHRAMVAHRLSAMGGHEIVQLRVPARQAHPAQRAFEF